MLCDIICKYCESKIDTRHKKTQCSTCKQFIHMTCVEQSDADQLESESFRCTFCKSIDTLQSQGASVGVNCACSNLGNVNFVLMAQQISKLSSQVDVLTRNMERVLRENEELKTLLNPKISEESGASGSAPSKQQAPPPTTSALATTSTGGVTESRSYSNAVQHGKDQRVPSKPSAPAHLSQNVPNKKPVGNVHSHAEVVREDVNLNQDETFRTVTYKKRRGNNVAQQPQPDASDNKMSKRVAQIGIRSSSLIKAVNSGKVRTKALFVSRVVPSLTAADLKTYLNNEISIPSVEVTRLKTKNNIDTYASFHITVPEDKFQIVNSTVVWPEGILFKPFLGPLTKEKMFSHVDPNTEDVNNRNNEQNVSN
ncbi:hypothetical protein M8J75_014799 [Diaphorina citri]|nr:hypothetical protein M8J75_012880 [Diaphorina citri]KAI5701270.1 hypothetical protein M8J75_007914 [Diaphorina citri]KAI5705689.1 hypothetical protein M8J75_000904 [Diaphorina citri]KAI5713242.1 hypothetical protein M8J75_014799 [Diaphorina citri]KAI5735285.1 hypothetical protein M8J77_016616 [Diaphorina citri]